MLIFDLDRTLVHTTTQRNAMPGFDGFPITVDGHDLYVHIRPHVLDYLKTLVRHNERWGVWTTGLRSYMNKVVVGLFAATGIDTPHDDVLEICLCRDDSTRIRDNIYVKDLSRFTGDVVLYDDDPIHAAFAANRGKVRLVPPFNVRTRASRLDCTFLVERCKKIEIEC